MPQVDRAGLYRGGIKDFGIALTSKKKLPQLLATFLATHLYNDATETWDEWDYGQTITGYFVLVSLNESGEVIKCLNYDQVMDAVGWDGVSYAGLAAMELKGTRVQFRVAEDSYKDQVTLKVNWIAAEEAEVGLRKLSGKDLTAMDAKFAVPTPAKTATPAKAPSAGKAKPKTRKPPKASAKTGKAPEPCTEEDAYQACNDTNEKMAKPVPGEILDDFWITAIAEIVEDDQHITNEEYAKIRDAVMVSLNIPF